MVMLRVRLITLALLAPWLHAQTPTVEQAKAFMDRAEETLLTLNVDASRADWVKSTFITYDTEILAAQADEKAISATVKLVKEAQRFKDVKLPPELARKFLLLRTSLTLATPADQRESSEVAQVASSMEGTYGRGKYCPAGGKCLDLEQLSEIMRSSRDPKQLEEAWVGWQSIAKPIKQPYARYVELGNKGARELGFADMGAMWRSQYDMPPDEFAKEVDRLWEQVKPLYLSLHAYVRAKLREKYGDLAPANGPIPSDLLGNMWAQEWDNIYPLLAPKNADPGYDLTEILKARKTSQTDLVHYAERFFTSLGFAPLPQTFWERSLFSRPRDRDVVCHASAWDIDQVDDLRIKACVEINADDFTTVHHEL